MGGETREMLCEPKGYDEVTGRAARRPITPEAITPEALAPLIERHGDRWNIWPSAQGAYACATLRRGLSWARPQGRNPVGPGGSYVRTLITESLAELGDALGEENRTIARLLADGTLTRDA